MANTILTPKMITREALRVLKNNLVFARGADRQYEDRFAKNGAKIGNTLDIKLPAQYTVTSGPNLAVQDYTEKFVTLTVDKQRHVDVAFQTTDLTLSLDAYSKNVIEPAMIRLANTIDRDGLELYKKVSNAVSRAGVITNSADNLRTYLNAGAKLNSNATPNDGSWSVITDEFTQAGIVDGLKGLFQSSTEISSQYKRGKMGVAAGFDWAMDQNIWAHTVGTAAADTITVNGASQTGTSLTVSGLTGTFTVGDIFTIAGVFEVNPANGESTGQLRQFTVTGQAANTINFLPAIIPTTGFQNVTNSPANSAAITVNGASGNITKECLAFHKKAFTLACVDLVVPQGAAWGATASDKDTGLSIRLVKDYDINTDREIARFDVLYGWAAVRPEWAVRIRSGSTPS